MSRLDPVSLRLFVRVNEKGSIAAAAEAEHIAAAAVSKRISELEKLLGTPLLRRTNRGVEPTQAGEALLTLARGALHILDQIPLQMVAYSTGDRGLVRLRASMSAISQFLPRAIKTFQDLHPDVQVQLESGTGSEVVGAVISNSADIGIYSGAPLPHSCETFPYRRDQLVLICPPDHALSTRKKIFFREALPFDLIGLEAGSAVNLMLAQAASAANRGLNLKIQVSSFESLCDMVAEGLGIGVLPRIIAERNSRAFDVHIVHLKDHWAERQFTLMVRSLAGMTGAGRLFAEHLLGDRRAVSA
jgi:DNA-binding transcriptional LysR family regulator